MLFSLTIQGFTLCPYCSTWVCWTLANLVTAALKRILQELLKREKPRSWLQLWALPQPSKVIKGMLGLQVCFQLCRRRIVTLAICFLSPPWLTPFRSTWMDDCSDEICLGPLPKDLDGAKAQVAMSKEEKQEANTPASGVLSQGTRDIWAFSEKPIHPPPLVI